MKRTTIIEIIIFLYCILFLYTGISKLIEYKEFNESIADSPILGPIAKPIALGLPLIEILLTLMIIVPRWRLKGLYASLILMVLFTLYVISLLLFSKKLPCSCGGILQQLTWPQHIIFNCVFVLLAGWAIVLQIKVNKAQKLNWDYNEYRTFSS